MVSSEKLSVQAFLSPLPVPFVDNGFEQDPLNMFKTFVSGAGDLSSAAVDKWFTLALKREEDQPLRGFNWPGTVVVMCPEDLSPELCQKFKHPKYPDLPILKIDKMSTDEKVDHMLWGHGWSLLTVRDLPKVMEHQFSGEIFKESPVVSREGDGCVYQLPTGMTCDQARDAFAQRVSDWVMKIKQLPATQLLISFLTSAVGSKALEFIHSADHGNHEHDLPGEQASFFTQVILRHGLNPIIPSLDVTRSVCGRLPDDPARSLCCLLGHDLGCSFTTTGSRAAPEGGTMLGQTMDSNGELVELGQTPAKRETDKQSSSK